MEWYHKVGVSVLLSSSWSFVLTLHHEKLHCIHRPFGLCYFRGWPFHIPGHVGQWVQLHLFGFLSLSCIKLSCSSLLKDRFNSVDDSSTCTRMPPNNSPVTSVTSDDLRCNVGGDKGVAGICTAPGIFCLTTILQYFILMKHSWR